LKNLTVPVMAIGKLLPRTATAVTRYQRRGSTGDALPESLASCAD
jgi:hypothetical protein